MDRFFEILNAMGQNMAAVLALLLVLSWVHNRARDLPPVIDRILLGALFGLVACWGMLSPAEIAPGVVVDSRVILISLAALFGGLTAGSVAALPVCVLRAAIGGPGAFGGILAVLAGLAVGVLFNRYVCRYGTRIRHRHLLLMGIVTTVPSLLSSFALPGELALATFRTFLFPVGVLYPLGTLVLGSLVLLETNRRRAEAARRESEERFRRATEASEISVWEWEVDGDLFRCSDNMADLFCIKGRKLPQTLGEFVSLPIPEDGARLREVVVSALASRDRFRIECRCVEADGGTRWHTVRGLVDRDAAGRGIRLVGIAADITARKQAQIALEKSEARLAEAQAISRTGSFEGNYGDEKLYWSDELYRMLELEPGSLVPRPDTYMEFTHPEDREGYRAAIRHALHTGEKFSHEFRPALPSGEHRVFLTYGSPIHDDSGNVVGLRGTVQDITERVRTEQELRNSEARYRSLVEKLPFCIHEIDTAGRIISMNPPGLAMIGVDAEEKVVGLPYLDMAVPRDRPRVEDLFQQALEGKHVRFEFEPLAGGSGRVFSSSFIPVRENEGGVTRIVGHAMDITHDRLRESALRDLATAIEQAAEAIVITDTDGIVQYVNPAYVKTTGYTRGETVGRAVSIVKSGEHDDAFYEGLWDTLSSGKTWHGEFVNMRKDGQRITLRATISPVVDETGRIVKYVSVQRDITHELALERQLLQAQKMEAVGTLAGGIAHDFNNILHAILGYCHIAEETEGFRDKEVARCVREIEAGANRAANLVGQILTFSRRSDAAFGPVLLPRLTREALQFLRGSLPSTVEIKQEITVRKGYVFGNDTQIHQVIANLSTNAFQAMEKKGGKIVVGLEREVVTEARTLTGGELLPGTYYCLRVADSGCGIEPEHLARIFDPFFTTKNVGKGTGLGLSSVHGIVTRMGGLIDVESHVDAGTTFRVYLPECDAPVSAETEAEDVAPGGRGQGSVLLVDDETSITTVATMVLERRGFRVRAFNDSVEAALTFEADPDAFDVVVCDFTMPKLNGIELARQIHARRPELPIVLATGIIEHDDVALSDAAGIREVMKKPFRMDTLAEVVMKYVPGHEA